MLNDPRQNVIPGGVVGIKSGNGGIDVVVLVVVVDDVVLVEVVGLVVVVVVARVWLTTKGCPAITTVALRGGPGATLSAIVADPEPLCGCTVIQSAKFCTVQPQVGPVVNPTVACPPVGPNDVPLALSEKLHCSGVVVVLLEAAVVVGSGALVASITSELNDSGLPLQSRKVCPPVQRRNCGSRVPPYSRSATHSGVSAVSVPLYVPASSVPTSSPVTCPLPPPGVT